MNTSDVDEKFALLARENQALTAKISALNAELSRARSDLRQSEIKLREHNDKQLILPFNANNTNK